MTHFPTALFLVLLALPAAAVDSPTDPGGASAPTGQVAPPELAAIRPCYDGPADTEGIGVCRGGTSYLLGRSYGPCLGQVVPGLESCNGLDDDCNGKPDDGLGDVTCGTGACAATAPACVNGKPGVCKPGSSPHPEICDKIDNDCNGVVDETCGCIHVAPTGKDADPGMAERPMRTITAAIARTAEKGQPKRVCVAAGSAPGATFDYPEAVVMQNGVSVYGGYQATGATWKRGGGVTSITAQDQRGVYFDDSIVEPTILDGFTVTGTNTASNAAITVEGSTGAVISNDIVTGGGGTVSNGISVAFKERAATPRITNCAISGGNGSDLATGISALFSVPVIQGNCSTFDPAGRCIADGCGKSERFIQGHTGGESGRESYAIHLESSPGAIIAQNALCGSSAMSTTVGLWLSGSSVGTIVRANHVVGRGGFNAVGISTEGCGAGPWIFDNAYIAATATGQNGRGDGIRSLGDCQPRINANLRIVGTETGRGRVEANGILCGMDPTGIPSRCLVVGNQEILGSLDRGVKMGSGVRCEGHGCAVVQGNAHISGNYGHSVIGLALVNAEPLVDANTIDAGCGMWSGTGLLSSNASARVQNNLILGNDCPPGFPSGQPATYAARVTLTGGPTELDLHSNVLQARGAHEACIGRALGIEAGTQAAETGSRGLVRNNILDPGLCDTAIVIEETGPARFRILEHNDLWSAKGATALVHRANDTYLTTIDQVNAMSDVTVNGNISANPLLEATGIAAGSPCRNAGTPTGAPTTDLTGRRRPAEQAPDIGPYEYVP